MYKDLIFPIITGIRSYLKIFNVMFEKSGWEINYVL